MNSVFFATELMASPLVSKSGQNHSISSGANPMPLMSRDLTDTQWAILDPLIPEPPRRKDRRGRPWKSRRSVLSGILWVLRTGAPWSDLPERYPLLPDVPSQISAMGAVGHHARCPGSTG
jgi:hypothetical protein